MPALLSVVLDRHAPEPLGRQLYLRLRDLILSGQLGPGRRLPSTRKLAEDLGVSRTVTLAAYDQLVVEGYLEPRRGSGQYVRAFDTRQCIRTRNRSSHPGRPAFRPGRPPSTLFPTRNWARLMGRGWRLDGRAATKLDEWAGLASLRAAIAGYLGELQGLEYTAEHVAITAGNTDALQLITRALGSPNVQGCGDDPAPGSRYASDHRPER